MTRIQSIVLTVQNWRKKYFPSSAEREESRKQALSNAIEKRLQHSKKIFEVYDANEHELLYQAFKDRIINEICTQINGDYLTLTDLEKELAELNRPERLL